jgi:hypothetical protein
MSNPRFGGGGGDDDVPLEAAAGMFSVIIEEPRIFTLDDLDGEISKTKTALDRAMEEHDQR